jgi:hypothetical protein
VRLRLIKVHNRSSADASVVTTTGFGTPTPVVVEKVVVEKESELVNVGGLSTPHFSSSTASLPPLERNFFPFL